MEDVPTELEAIFERFTVNGLDIPLDERISAPDRNEDLVAQVARQMERLEAEESSPSLLGAISSSR